VITLTYFHFSLRFYFPMSYIAASFMNINIRRNDICEAGCNIVATCVGGTNTEWKRLSQFYKAGASMRHADQKIDINVMGKPSKCDQKKSNETEI